MNEHPDEKTVDLFIGHVAHGEVDPGGLVYDGAVVGEGLEALAAVVAAHAAVADAAEGHVVGGQVDDGVVDAPAAEGAGVQDLGLGLLAAGEEVEGQGLFPAVDEAQGLVQVVVGNDGQDGAEDLFAHGLGQALQGVGHQGGGDPAAVGLRVVPVPAAVENVLVFQEALQAVVVLMVDDADKVPVGQGVLAQHLFELLDEFVHQLVPDLAIDQAVVRGHAGLAGV